MTARFLALVALLPGLTVIGCASSKSAPDCSTNPADYHPTIVASDFSSTIDNPFLPWTPGTVYRHVDTDGNIVETTVTTDTKTILGIATVVVRDTNTSPAGDLNEDTFDYYAQDSAGNVWYFGEATKAYVGTQVSTTGSWVAGENCAEPGIVMEASPKVGDSYRQEYLPGEAEDEAKIVSLTATVTVPYGTFDNCVETEESTALAPGDVENKYYCSGLGEVRAHDIGSIDTGKTEDLVSVNGNTAP